MDSAMAVAIIADPAIAAIPVRINITIMMFLINV